MRHFWAFFAYVSFLSKKFSGFIFPVFCLFSLVTIARFNQLKIQGFPSWKRSIIFPIEKNSKKDMIETALKEGQYSLAQKLAHSGTQEDIKLSNLPSRISKEEIFWESVIRAQPTVSQALTALGVLAESKGDTLLSKKLYTEAKWLHPTNN